MVIRSIITAVATLLLAGQVHATRTGYDAQQNTLTIPSVELEGVRYNFPKVRIISVEVVDPGIVSQAPAELHTCVPNVDPITIEKSNAIQIGMTLDEVNQIMGCQYNPPVYSINDSCTNCTDQSFEVFDWGFGFSNVIFVHVDNVTHRVVYKNGRFITP